MMVPTISLLPGDNRESLRRLIDDGVRVHSVVTDPPYGLVSVVKRFGGKDAAPAKYGTDGAFARASRGFMHLNWDGTGIERDPEFWKLIYDILLPGGFVFAFSGSRTGHWQACAMETAGFVMHPMHGWVFGCLDTDTFAATPDGDRPYTELKPGDEVICYDPATGEYSAQPILEVVEYEYADTAYRLVGDRGEQVVSRNHRCIVERNGRETIHFAEALEQQENVPFLEDLQGLREALRLQRFEVDSEPGLLQSLQEHPFVVESRSNSDSNLGSKRSNDRLPGLLDGNMEAERLASEDFGHPLLQSLVSGEGDIFSDAYATRWQGSVSLDRKQPAVLSDKNDRPAEPRLEGRGDNSPSEGQSRISTDKVCPLSSEAFGDESERWLHRGTSSERGTCDGQDALGFGGGTSHRPRCDEQRDSESDAVQKQLRSQEVRAWAGHTTDVVRVVPFHYVGKVWCLRVPTGAFVAVRNGVAFPTGNSGFPKAHDAAKAIDKMLGAEGGFVPEGNPVKRLIPGADLCATGDWAKTNGRMYQPGEYQPGSPEAQAWGGWAYGTQSQKPALEPIYLGQKPFSEKTGAANLLKHGVGAFNIDGCRVGVESMTYRTTSYREASSGEFSGQTQTNFTTGEKTVEGRWPANLILDGSPEVVDLFPDSKGQQGDVRGTEATPKRTEVGGSAARFFHNFHADPVIYQSKAGKADRAGGTHPTVKPIALMQYLIRHITPPGGTVLDPFAGSGTTGEAAKREGFDCILMEAEPDYVEFLNSRFDLQPQVDNSQLVDSRQNDLQLGGDKEILNWLLSQI